MITRPHKGYLITFEGGEGGGKTSVYREIFSLLQQKGLDVVLRKEPGGTSIGDQVRDILHSMKNTEMVPKAELLGYMMSRAQNVEENLEKDLEKGSIVMLDRFTDSSIVYQGYAHGVGASNTRWLNQFATGGLEPDLTLFFDVDPEVGLERKDKGHKLYGDEWTRMDALELKFHRDVQYAYRILYAYDETGRWEWIDANKSKEEVFEQTLEIVRTRLCSAGFLEGNQSSPERRR